MTHEPILLVLDGLACYRLTRLVVADTITAPLRDRLAGQRPAVARSMGGERMIVAKRPRVAEFVHCPWCVSPYLAAAVVACQALAAAPWLYVAAVLAFSAIAGLLSEHH
jgi:hypothetical protein